MTNRLHPTRKLLRVQSEFFVAGAVWMKIYGVWSCIHASHVLRWMRGLTPMKAEAALLKMDARWQWLPAVAPAPKRLKTRAFMSGMYEGKTAAQTISQVGTNSPPVPPGSFTPRSMRGVNPKSLARRRDGKLMAPYG